MQQNDPKLERIKEIVTQQVSRIDFQVRKMNATFTVCMIKALWLFLATTKFITCCNLGVS